MGCWFQEIIDILLLTFKVEGEVKTFPSIFYTNEKKIIEAFGAIIPKIEAAKDEFYK